MANENRGGIRNFDDMSNADLVAFIGGDIDPNTNRADLIIMAMEADESRRGQNH